MPLAQAHGVGAFCGSVERAREREREREREIIRKQCPSRGCVERERERERLY